MNVVNTSINNYLLILAKCPLYNFFPRGVCVFEKAKTTVGKPLYAMLKCKRKTKIHGSFN